MSWVNNLLSYCESGDSGQCPVCGSKGVAVQEHIYSERKSLTFACEECGASDHFDGSIKAKEK